MELLNKEELSLLEKISTETLANYMKSRTGRLELHPSAYSEVVLPDRVEIKPTKPVYKNQNEVIEWLLPMGRYNFRTLGIYIHYIEFLDRIESYRLYKGSELVEEIAANKGSNSTIGGESIVNVISRMLEPKEVVECDHRNDCSEIVPKFALCTLDRMVQGEFKLVVKMGQFTDNSYPFWIMNIVPLVRIDILPAIPTYTPQIERLPKWVWHTLNTQEHQESKRKFTVEFPSPIKIAYLFWGIPKIVNWQCTCDSGNCFGSKLAIEKMHYVGTPSSTTINGRIMRSSAYDFLRIHRLKTAMYCAGPSKCKFIDVHAAKLDIVIDAPYSTQAERITLCGQTEVEICI